MNTRTLSPWEPNFQRCQGANVYGFDSWPKSGLQYYPKALPFADGEWTGVSFLRKRISCLGSHSVMGLTTTQYKSFPMKKSIPRAIVYWSSQLHVSKSSPWQLFCGWLSEREVHFLRCQEGYMLRVLLMVWGFCQQRCAQVTKRINAARW